jgi:hypothetical protein
MPGITKGKTQPFKAKAFQRTRGSQPESKSGSSSSKQLAKPSGVMGLRTDDDIMETIPPS